MKIPKVLYKNSISDMLDEVKDNYGKLVRRGYIYGLIAIDQDAKIIAVDKRIDRDINYFDLSSVGAALYGVARQGKDFFETQELKRATIIYQDLQLYVKSIGRVTLAKKGKREVLIVILSDHKVNLGVILLQLQKYGKLIRTEIEKSGTILENLEKSEHEFKVTLRKLKESMNI
mgnify:CR=1 FL=1